MYDYTLPPIIMEVKNGKTPININIWFSVAGRPPQTHGIVPPPVVWVGGGVVEVLVVLIIVVEVEVVV